MRFDCKWTRIKRLINRNSERKLQLLRNNNMLEALNLDVFQSTLTWSVAPSSTSFKRPMTCLKYTDKETLSDNTFHGIAI